LPALKVSDHADVLRLVETNGLTVTGVGWIDAHLLCAAEAATVQIWTGDARLRNQAARLGLVDG
jgi:predicted nucleic acid-binding protein